MCAVTLPPAVPERQRPEALGAAVLVAASGRAGLQAKSPGCPASSRTRENLGQCMLLLVRRLSPHHTGHGAVS